MSCESEKDQEACPSGGNNSMSKSQSIIALIKTDEVKEEKGSRKRLKDVEINVPIVYGSNAFWLGEKANQKQTHKWTVYVRSATYEDLGVVVKRAVFRLHPSFDNPIRVVKSPPFELSESSCGEFDISIRLYFHKYICPEKLELHHRLKLYPRDETLPWSTKKPVLSEHHDEIVFSEPSEGFYTCVKNHPAVVPTVHYTKYPLVNQFIMNVSDAYNLLKEAVIPKTADEREVEKDYLRRQVQQLQERLQRFKPPEYSDQCKGSDDELSSDEEEMNPFYRERVKGVFETESDSDTEVPRLKGNLPAIDLKAPPVFDKYDDDKRNEKGVHDTKVPVFDKYADDNWKLGRDEVMLSQVHPSVLFKETGA